MLLLPCVCEELAYSLWEWVLEAFVSNAFSNLPIASFNVFSGVIGETLLALE